MKYYIDNDVFENAREAADYIMEHTDDNYYDDMLDECHEMVNVCGYEYYPSRALYLLDEIAYNCGRTDWEDSEACDIEYELERMDDGETLEFYDYEVLAEDDG